MEIIRVGMEKCEMQSFDIVCVFLLRTYLTKPAYMQWFNLCSETYENFSVEPLGKAGEDEEEKKKNPPRRRLGDHMEKLDFAMQILDTKPFADYRQIHKEVNAAGFLGCYNTTRRALIEKGVKVRNHPPQEWCGPEGIEVFKQRRLTYAEAHKNDYPQDLYFINESSVRCIHREKKQLCKKGQRPEPYERIPYTAQCRVLGVIGHGGFRKLVTVTELLAEKRKERLVALRRRREQPNGGEAEAENDKFKYGFQAVDYQKVLDAHIIAPIREHNRRINAGRRPEDRVEPVLVQDRAPSHWAKDTLDYLEDAGMKIHYDWPRCSPDRSPIENVWGWLVYDLGKGLYAHRQNTAEKCEKVWKLVRDYFYNRIEPERITKLVERFSRRAQRVAPAGSSFMPFLPVSAGKRVFRELCRPLKSSTANDSIKKSPAQESPIQDLFNSRPAVCQIYCVRQFRNDVPKELADMVRYSSTLKEVLPQGYQHDDHAFHEQL